MTFFHSNSCLSLPAADSPPADNIAVFLPVVGAPAPLLSHTEYNCLFSPLRECSSIDELLIVDADQASCTVIPDCHDDLCCGFSGPVPSPFLGLASPGPQ